MVTNTTNESQSKESLSQKDKNGALCKISSSQSSQSSTSLSTTKSNEIIDSNDHENSNDTTTLNSVSIQMTKVDDTNNPDMKSGNGDDINSDKTNNDNSGNKEKCTLTNNLLFNSTSSASTYSICQFPYYSNQKYHHYNQNYPYDIKSPTVSTIYSIRNNNPSSSILTEKTETLLPIMKSSNVCNMNYATEKSLNSMLYLNKNNMNPLSDSCLYDNNNEISCIPIIVQKNSWSNTSPINNNDNNKNSNSTREFGSDAINSDDNHRTPYRESLLNDNEVRPPKQNIISWGCLPSPITEVSFI